MSSLELELLRLEQGFWDAAGDGAFYAAHMLDEGCCLLPVGRLTKVATIKAISQAEPWSSFGLHEVQIAELADDAAMIYYRATASRPGGDRYEALVASTYRHTDDGWKLLVHQQTPLG